MKFMIIRNILIFCFLSTCSICKAQTYIKGIVKNKQSNEPIINASVFLSNTTFGTITNESGYFEIKFNNQLNTDLVISSIGFKTNVININQIDIEKKLTIFLTPKHDDLDEVIVEDFKKETWQKWGRFFIENFIGVNPNSSECEILNTESIKFKFSKKNQQLIAYCDSFLIIQNKALGYNIQYKLENFEYNFKNNILYFEGYPLFNEANIKRKRLREKIRVNREIAYKGSSTHFFKSLYQNQLQEQGFVVRKLVKEPNLVKQNLNAYLNNIVKQKGFNGINDFLNKSDSAAYFKKILREADVIEKLYKNNLKTSDFVITNKEGKVFLSFADFLHITYINTLESESFLSFFNLNRNPSNPISLLTLPNDEAVEVYSNGNYFNPRNLLRSGYWSWSEKISTLLPLDYELKST